MIPANADRWALRGRGIEWDASSGDAHEDHVEMSGLRTSVIVTYGQDIRGRLQLRRRVIYPLLRTIPNDTHASTVVAYGEELLPDLRVEGVPVAETLVRVRFDGVLEIETTAAEARIRITRWIFPSPESPRVHERVVVHNRSDETLRVEMASLDRCEHRRGSKGSYRLTACRPGWAGVLEPGAEAEADGRFDGTLAGEVPSTASVRDELELRCSRVDAWNDTLVLESPDPVVDQAFRFAKLRACESVFHNRCGLLHSPGGGTYYAAIWTNDQIEYAGPFFPFVGDPAAVEASINAYALFRPFMGEDYHFLPSSIIAEGQDIWEGAGDRGDAAMYLYGVSRFLLAHGDRKLAAESLPALRWCIEYNHRQKGRNGVLRSDSDELENRFPTGDANLCTSSLAYGGLVSMSHLAAELGDEGLARECSEEAEALLSAIERHFGRQVSGYDTYRYYEGNDVLRAWIAIPLTMGILTRSAQTVAALFSPTLWTEDGLATQAGEKTFWDRATLYGLRGVFHAGYSGPATRPFLDYSRRRLLGDHVPYAVEAWPEGDQRHLSAESALYGRVVTEGIFGIVPTGFRSFLLKPSLPENWDRASLLHIKAFQADFDIKLERQDGSCRATVTSHDGRGSGMVAVIPEGSSVDIDLSRLEPI
jgi:hypothetical protein